MKATSWEQLVEIATRVLHFNRGLLDGDKSHAYSVMPRAEFERRLTLCLNNGLEMSLRAPSLLPVNREHPFNVEHLLETLPHEGRHNRPVAVWLGDVDRRAAYSGNRGEPAQDQRSIAMTEVDFANVCFTHCLEGGEMSTDGITRIERLRATDAILLDAKICQALYLEDGQFTLWWLFHKRHITHLDFPGTVMRDRENGPCILGLSCSKGNQNVWGMSWDVTTRQLRKPWTGQDALWPSAVIYA